MPIDDKTQALLDQVDNHDLDMLVQMAAVKALLTQIIDPPKPPTAAQTAAAAKADAAAPPATAAPPVTSASAA
jgi:hypothetical protein